MPVAGAFIRRSVRSAVVCLSRSQAVRMAGYSVEERGSPYSLDYRVFFKSGDQYISPFHDIPLYANPEKTVFNMVVEVPRWTNAKMEINKEEPLNPIKQDVKKGKPRYVNNCFPYHGYIWNYGAFPQTWEDPNHIPPETNAKGDNDPLDVCEVGESVGRRGEVKQVKILGTIALIDEGETDWKILAIDVEDPLAAKINDIADLEANMPGLLEATVHWFKVYKIPAGKPPNEFAFGGQAKDRAFATAVVEDTHAHWKALVTNQPKPDSISCSNTTVSVSPYLISPADAKAIVDQTPPLGPPAAIPSGVDKVYYGLK